MQLIDLLLDYGWQAVVVSLLSLTLVEISKLWVRKLVKSANVRHVLYTALSWVFALGFTAALSAILKRLEGLWSLYGAAFTVTTILGKLCADAGLFNWIETQIKSIWESMTENGKWSKAIREVGSALGVDTVVLDSVATKVEEEYLPLIEAGAELFFNNNQEELTLNMKQKLAGFVSNEKLQEVAEGLFKKLKESWVSSKKENLVAEGSAKETGNEKGN